MSSDDTTRANGAYVVRDGPVARVVLRSFEESSRLGAGRPGFLSTPLALMQALAELRYDPEVRVVVLTGENDGEFYRVARTSTYLEPDQAARLDPIRRAGPAPAFPFPHAHESLLLMEKPVVARVNGDAIGAGADWLWCCDLIVAREDALLAVVHLGQGEVEDSDGVARGFPWAVTPGGGSLAALPAALPPTKLKEYLFLARAWTAADLAALGVINHAVPAGRLDEVVDALVAALLGRPAFVLAHAKRVANKALVEQWNLAQDLAWAHEELDFFLHAAGTRV